MNMQAKFSRALSAYYSAGELKTLTFDLGVQSQEICSDHNNKRTLARDMVTYFKRRGRLQDLVNLAASHRPNVDWSEFGGPEEQEFEPAPELEVTVHRRALGVIAKDLRSMIEELLSIAHELEEYNVQT